MRLEIDITEDSGGNPFAFEFGYSFDKQSLISISGGSLLDYRYTPGESFPLLVSAGPDKLFGTIDDIKRPFGRVARRRYAPLSRNPRLGQRIRRGVVEPKIAVVK